MTAQLLEKVTSTPEQYFILPGWQSWQQFKAIEAAIAEVPGARITYLDGRVELMTTSENHEEMKKAIAILLEAYLFEKGIRFIPVGNATREDEGRKVSFEPDESYYIGEKKEQPDLTIEVVVTSGGTGKLEKYKRLKIAEVWFWQNNRLSIYSFRGQEYEQVNRSEVLPELDISFLVRCLQIADVFDARTEFIKGLR